MGRRERVWDSFEFQPTGLRLGKPIPASIRIAGIYPGSDSGDPDAGARTFKGAVEGFQRRRTHFKIQPRVFFSRRTWISASVGVTHRRPVGLILEANPSNAGRVLFTDWVPCTIQIPRA